MRIDIITLFPDLFVPFSEWSMIKKAREVKALDLKTHDLRSWAIDKRGTVDDKPYGGGPGMILKPEPIFKAVASVKERKKKTRIILLSPKGKVLTQKTLHRLKGLEQLILICGHYEDVDQRVREHLIDEEISIGNYVLSGGEIPAMIITDGVNRLLAGVLEKEGAKEIESFSPGLKKFSQASTDQLLEFPQYTRPEKFKGWKVPEVLLSGNHQKINQWRTRKVKKLKT